MYECLAQNQLNNIEALSLMIARLRERSNRNKKRKLKKSRRRYPVHTLYLVQLRPIFSCQEAKIRTSDICFLFLWLSFLLIGNGVQISGEFSISQSFYPNHVKGFYLYQIESARMLMMILKKKKQKDT